MKENNEIRTLYKVTAFNTDKSLLNVARDPSTWPLKFPDKEKTLAELKDTLGALENLNAKKFRTALSILSRDLKNKTMQGAEEWSEVLFMTHDLERAKKWALTRAESWNECGTANLMLISVYDIEDDFHGLIKKDESWWFLAEWTDESNVTTCKEISPPLSFAHLWGE